MHSKYRKYMNKIKGHSVLTDKTRMNCDKTKSGRSLFVLSIVVLTRHFSSGIPQYLLPCDHMISPALMKILLQSQKSDTYSHMINIRI